MSRLASGLLSVSNDGGKRQKAQLMFWHARLNAEHVFLSLTFGARAVAAGAGAA